jgi:hypothetical protein
MHLGGAGIGEADVNSARNQGPHQTFRTVHSFTPVRDHCFGLVQDQSFPARFVKGFGDTPPSTVESFLTAAFENQSPHGLVACEIAPIVACLAAEFVFFERTK